ncbi:putative ABC transport system permease protein [Candidatus Methanomarinus sp.]|nr:putative ABC transport system permease protein [ANME-2 cluster archaeon]
MIEEFSMAFKQLRMKKVRTLLILLGISVGVAAVIGVTSLGEGIRVNAVAEIQKSHDLTLIEVSPGVSNAGIILITDSKVHAIEPYGTIVSPYVMDDYVTLNKTYFEVLGITTDYQDAKELELETGSWFEEETYGIVLGSDIAEKFEKIEEIEIGDTIEARIRLYGIEGKPIDKDVEFTVVGILEPTDTQADDQSFIDINIATGIDEKDVYNGIIVKVDSANQAPDARAAIEKQGLTCYSAQDEIDSINKIMKAITLVLAFFSSISLIVGALMIINTMIVSVYERTREIGIAKAVGASQTDIIRIFLSECIIIGILGGLLGDLFGIIFSVMIDKIGKPLLVMQLDISEIEHLTAINMEILIAGFLISLVISIISGLYPAWRASKLDPVKALRQL